MKEQGRRADFKFEFFETLLESKGYRMAWWRASICPCTPVNTQADSPDPNCSLCHGIGWLYYGMDTPLTDKVGDLDEIQQDIVGRDSSNHAAVIRAIQTGIVQRPDSLDRQGRWIYGETTVTVRNENQIGYWDRLINLDAIMVFSELLTAGANGALTNRYLATGMNLLRSKDKIYQADVDFTLSHGRVVWLPGHAPDEGTRLSLHYLCHPSWVVVDHPHTVRASNKKFKTKYPQTPQGNYLSLPLQAHVKLEFLTAQ